MGMALEISNILGLGVEAKELTFLQISLRGVIVFIALLIMVRVGAKRFLARMTALDAIVGFILASMLARAVNGSAAFFPTLGGGFVIVLLHRLLAWLSFRVKWVETLTKGKADQLVKDGNVRYAAAKRNYMTQRDLVEELRLNGNIENPKEVKAAFIERSGEMSVIK